MPKIEFEQEFPCGYKMKIKACSAIREIDVSNIILGICPLHGKKCNEYKRIRLKKG